jgi:chromate reductase
MKDGAEQVSLHAAHDQIRFLVFSGSLRKDSLNTQLARLATDIISRNGSLVDWAELADFVLPDFNQDFENEQGFPPAAVNFKTRLENNDAFVIASPEYNASIPGALKNVIDWASRFKPQPFNGKHGLLVSASPSMVGGNRGLWALRIPLEHLSARVFPEMFSLALAHKAFTAEGQLSDALLAKRLETTIQSFMDLVEAVKRYPCVQKTWEEFPGEKSEGLNV